MRTHLRTLADEGIVFTGTAWKKRSELERIVRDMGAKTPLDVTADTTVLVRGTSAVWKFGDYGRKERRAATLLRRGQNIALVYDFEFRKLVEKGRPARVSDRIAGQPMQWLLRASRRQFQRVASIVGPLDREHSALGRVEQSFLRCKLFSEDEEGICSLCGRRLPTSLLVAAHIKARSECTRRERLDAEHIVFSLCLLGCDALYERGLVGVQRGGAICLSEANDSATLKRVLRVYSKRKCPAWSQPSAEYFDWHLTHRFQA